MDKTYKNGLKVLYENLSNKKCTSILEYLSTLK
jgi:hypothetical protein